MNFEILNFFPSERKDSKKYLKGTLHLVAQIGDDRIHIRGFNVIKKKDKWFIRLPYKNAIDPVTKDFVGYPVFSFESDEKNKMIMNFLYEKAPSFIEDYLAANPQPIEAPTSKEQPAQRTSKENSKQVPSLQKKSEPPKACAFTIKPGQQFQDPPKRNVHAKR